MYAGVQGWKKKCLNHPVYGSLDGNIPSRTWKIFHLLFSRRDSPFRDLLAGWSGEDPQALAGAILAECRRRGALRDDCAVQAVYFPEAGVKRA